MNPLTPNVETMAALVKVGNVHWRIDDNLEDGIRRVFMLIPTQKRRMELFNAMFDDDATLVAFENEKRSIEK